MEKVRDGYHADVRKERGKGEYQKGLTEKYERREQRGGGKGYRGNVKGISSQQKKE